MFALLPVSLRAADSFPQRQVVSSSHFRVRHQSPYAPAGVLNVLEGLHAKLLLELLPFAPWARGQAVDLYLYKDGAAYRAGTGVPGWAGAHVDVRRRAIHAYEDPAFQQRMAHELAHLFFEDFFAARDRRPPDWLNEGVATLMERDYGLEGEEKRLAAVFGPDKALPLGTLFNSSYRDGSFSGRDVSLWYWQSYSVTRFLMRRFSRAQFVEFCAALREGSDVDAALRQAYGPQLPDTAALERFWKQDLRGS